MFRRIFQTFLLLIVFSMNTGMSRAADAELEYQVKAVCVLNAARFVGWPPSAFNDSAAPIVVGILGENPFGQLLQKVTSNETVQQRRIVIRKVSLEDATSCHIVFVSRSEKDQLGTIAETLGQTSVLTISEIERFASSGGIIGLTVENGKVRFEINLGAARRARLKIDSRLLSLARIVK